MLPCLVPWGVAAVPIPPVLWHTWCTARGQNSLGVNAPPCGGPRSRTWSPSLAAAWRGGPFVASWSQVTGADLYGDWECSFSSCVVLYCIASYRKATCREPVSVFVVAPLWLAVLCCARWMDRVRAGRDHLHLGSSSSTFVFQAAGRVLCSLDDNYKSSTAHPRLPPGPTASARQRQPAYLPNRLVCTV